VTLAGLVPAARLALVLVLVLVLAVVMVAAVVMVVLVPAAPLVPTVMVVARRARLPAALEQLVGDVERLARVARDALQDAQRGLEFGRQPAELLGLLDLDLDQGPEELGDLLAALALVLVLVVVLVVGHVAT
jgi:hypothetical protein